MNHRQIASTLCLLLAFAPAAHAWTPFGGGYKQQVKAENIETDTTNFNGACSSTDTNVQSCLDQLDDAVSGGFTSGTITGKTLVTAASGDNLIIADASDGYNLKKVDAADFLAAGSGDITSVVAGNGLTGGATSGDATLDIGPGFAMDVSADAIDWDPTEVTGNRTWGDGTDATIAWTWNLSGTDPVWTFGSGTAALTGNISATNLSGTNTGDQTTITGNAGTATALAANGTNCAAGEYPLGVDASGAVESCTDATTEIAAYAQPLEATLTDIADGTILEDLINTANPWADNEVSDTITVGASGSVNDAAIPSGITRDTEWDTESEVQTAWGAVNILLETEIDASSELAALMDDETGSGALVFADDASINLDGGNLEIPNSISLPGTCTVGQIYMDTDATTGQRIYACESTNTWVLQGDGGGGGGDSVSVDGVGVVDPNFASTGDIDFVDTSNTVTANINANSIVGGDLSTSIAITSTGAQDYGGATSFEVPNGASPTVDAAGETAIDTTDDQLIYYGGAKRVISYEQTRCFIVPSVAAADDNMPMGSFGDATTITNVWCTCSGTCTTKATFTLEDGSGTAMTITGTNPTCTAIGTVPTAAAVTASNSLTARESLRFDVTNTPSPETDTYELCVSYTTDAQ